MNKGIKMYEKVGLETEILNADPHRVVQILMEGFISRLNIAIGYIRRKEFTSKTNYINKAVDILTGLLVSLDMESGGEVAQNLDEMYRFMMRQLVTANMKNDPDTLERVRDIMQTIKEGWDAIPEEIKTQYNNEQTCV